MDNKKYCQRRRARGAPLAAALLLAGLCLLTGCTAGQAGPTGLQPPTAEPRPAVESGELQFAGPVEGDLIAEIVTDWGTIRAVLYSQQAPLAVENFTALAGETYYDGSQFHRVSEGFVIQGGAGVLPEGEDAVIGSADRSVWGHPFASEFSSTLRHYAGALCMAPEGGPDTHLSQFYIVAAAPASLDEAALAKLGEAGLAEEIVEAYRQAGGLPYLDNTDTVFGHVFVGMEVVDTIAASPCNEEGVPERVITIESIRIAPYAPADDAPAASSQGETAGGTSAPEGSEAMG